MNISIKDVQYHLPKNVLSNADLKTMFPDFDDEKFSTKIGIKERRIASSDETALDLGFQAAQKVVNETNRQTIDFILFCTQSPDYFLPTSACILQERLGLPKNIGAMDFNLGCSGFIYGLAVAKGLLQAGIAKNILFITAETYSKYLHPKNKSNRAIFGDAGAATLLSATGSGSFGEFVLGTDGKGFDKLIIANGGSKSPKALELEETRYGTNDITDHNHLYMDGPEIFNFTIETIPQSFQEILTKNSLELDEIDYIIFHQANKYMLEYLRKKIKITPEKFHNELYLTGNTVSCTIPIALADAIKEGKVKQGNKVLLLGFGVGLSWGGTVITI